MKKILHLKLADFERSTVRKLLANYEEYFNRQSPAALPTKPGHMMCTAVGAFVFLTDLTNRMFENTMRRSDVQMAYIGIAYFNDLLTTFVNSEACTLQRSEKIICSVIHARFESQVEKYYRLHILSKVNAYAL